MKKLLLLGSVLTAASLHAQTTYYWPGERVTELTNQSQYFIYNTTIDPSQNESERTNFLYSNGTQLATSKVKPSQLVTSNTAYLFKVVKPESRTSENHWYLHSAHGIVGIGGQTNNEEIRDLYITYWNNQSQVTKSGSAKSERADQEGEYVDPNTTDNKVWTISKSDAANADESRDYAWNGEPNSWVTWSDAHPYAFYNIMSKELSAEASEAYDQLINLANDKYFMQQSFGLAKEAANYSTNAQETSEGPIANLIDGDESTFFHSTWSGTDPAGEDKHYIQIRLDQPTTSFVFYTSKRNDNNRPTEIKISVSNDGTNFTELQTINSADLIAAKSYISPRIEATAPFQHIRFEVMATNTSSKFFTYSEFYVLDADQYANLIDATSEAQAPDFIKNSSEEEIISKWNNLRNNYMRPAMLESLSSLIQKAESYPIGEGLGAYSALADFQSVINTAKTISLENSYTEIQEAINEVQAQIDGITINQPEAGKFYRFKSKANNKYISSITSVVNNNTRPTMVDAADATTTFYLSANGMLTSSNFLNLNSWILDGPTGTAFTFEASNTIGGYMLTDGTSAMYAGNTNLDRWGKNGNPSPENKVECAWTIEEVTDPQMQQQITKNLSADYATLAAPVALNIPEGVKAYTVSAEGTTAILEEISGRVIPAEIPVVLHREGTTDTEVTFTCAPAADYTATEANSLVGVYKETPVETSTNAYVLGNGNQGIGFYQMSDDDRIMGANKAYLALPASMSAVRSITIGGPTTGIENTVAEGAAQEEYYDLQGRRVMNPTKGIYVTKSGKKVVFNK